MQDPPHSLVEPAAAPERAPRLALGTALATAAQLAPLLASAGISLAIARLYGPSGTGRISLVLNLFNTLLMVFTFGLSSGITFLLSRREWPLGAAARPLAATALVLGLAGAACGVAFYFLTRHSMLRQIPADLAIVSLISMPFAIGWAFAAACALARESYSTYAMLELTNSAVILIGGVALALTFGLLGAICAFAASQVLTALIGGWWVRGQARRETAAASPADTPPVRPLRRAARFGLQAWTANLLQLLNYRFDIFILAAFASRADVGVYSIAVSVTALGWVLPDALQTVLFPRVARLDAAAQAGELSVAETEHAAARAIRHAVILLLPVAVVLAALVFLVPLVYGARFHHSVVLGLILIPGVAALGVAKVISAILTGRGFPRYSLYITAITVPITLALYFLLIPGMHADGAALASTVSYVLTVVLSLSFLRRVTSIGVRQALVPTLADTRDYGHAFRLARHRLRA